MDTGFNAKSAIFAFPEVYRILLYMLIIINRLEDIFGSDSQWQFRQTRNPVTIA